MVSVGSLLSRVPVSSSGRATDPWYVRDARLWSRTKTSIAKRSNGQDPFSKDAETNLTVVFTVPASWSERGKQGILMAATKAGITKEADAIRLVSEAEAAAIYGLRVQAQDGTVDNEDCIIVCDAGGGTVDGELPMMKIARGLH